MNRRSWLLSVQVSFQLVAVLGLILGTIVHLGGVDADPSGVAGTHLVRHDEDQVGVGDLSHTEGSET